MIGGLFAGVAVFVWGNEVFEQFAGGVVAFIGVIYKLENCGPCGGDIHGASQAAGVVIVLNECAFSLLFQVNINGEVNKVMFFIHCCSQFDEVFMAFKVVEVAADAVIVGAVVEFNVEVHAHSHKGEDARLQALQLFTVAALVFGFCAFYLFRGDDVFIWIAACAVMFEFAVLVAAGDGLSNVANPIILFDKVFECGVV